MNSFLEIGEQLSKSYHELHKGPMHYIRLAYLKCLKTNQKYKCCDTGKTINHGINNVDLSVKLFMKLWPVMAQYSPREHHSPFTLNPLLTVLTPPNVHKRILVNNQIILTLPASLKRPTCFDIGQPPLH